MSCRVTLALVGFLGFLNLYAMRINLSVAIVCMVNQTAVAETEGPAAGVVNNSGKVDQCLVQDTDKATTQVGDK